MTDSTSTPFTRQFKADCAALTERLERKNTMQGIPPNADLTVRRAAPSEAAFKAVAEWFDDETTTELFLRQLADTGFKVVPIAAP